MKLRSKIILILLFVSVVPLIIVGYMDTKSDREVLGKQFEAEGVEFGRQVLRSIHLHLHDVCQEIHGLSHSIPKEVFTEGTGLDQADSLIKAFRKSGSKFHFICVLDTSGKVLASTYPGGEGKDFSKRAGFAAALGGKIDIQQPAFEKIGENYVMMISFPISEISEHHIYATDHDEVLGVIMVAIKWSRIDAIVKATRIVVGEKNIDNHVILIDDKGLVLSCSDPNMVFTTNLIDLGMQSAAKVVKGEDGHIIEANEHGKESFISYHSFHKYRTVPELGWSILVVRDPKLVFASVDILRRIMLWTLAIIVLVLIPVSIILSGRLSGPIHMLSEAAKAFGEGDLSRRVDIRRSDEIGTLGVSFNLMAEQMEKYSKSLEGLVKARTVELEDANTELIVRMEELWHIDEALRQSEEKYRTLVENIDMYVTMVDVDHNILFVNSAQCKVFGKKPEELVGKKCYWVFKKCDAVCGYCPGDLAMKTGKTETVETEGVLENGEHIPVQLMASPLYDHENNPRGFIEIVENIAERKRVESELREYQEKLRSMASKLTLSEEHERRRIANGLHDSIIQPLAFIKMKLETLLKKEETGDELMASLRRMLEETSGLMAMTRGFTFELSYPILYEFGLEAAMDEWLREEIREKHGLKTAFNDDSEDKPLEDDMRSFLFGAFRELLVNVIKHAEAKKINVAVSREGDKIAICVRDDGVGFDCAQRRPVLAKGSGFGLFGIRDRLEYLGGDFKIESEVGCGTVVVLRAPLQQGT